MTVRFADDMKWYHRVCLRVGNREKPRDRGVPCSVYLLSTGSPQVGGYLIAGCCCSGTSLDLLSTTVDLLLCPGVRVLRLTSWSLTAPLAVLPSLYIHLRDWLHWGSLSCNRELPNSWSRPNKMASYQVVLVLNQEQILEAVDWLRAGDVRHSREEEVTAIVTDPSAPRWFQSLAINLDRHMWTSDQTGHYSQEHITRTLGIL